MNRFYRRYLAWRLRILKTHAERLTEKRKENLVAASAAHFMDLTCCGDRLERKAARCAYLAEACEAKALIIATQLDANPPPPANLREALERALGEEPIDLGEWAPKDSL